MTQRVRDYAPRNHITATISGSEAPHDPAVGIGFAFGAGMKLLLASIALSALVLWALSCGGIRG